MNEAGGAAAEAAAQFEALGRIVDHLGYATVGRAIEQAAQRREAGLAGPAISHPIASEQAPAYGLAFREGEVSFALDGVAGRLPVSVLETLMNHDEADVAAVVQGAERLID